MIQSSPRLTERPDVAHGFRVLIVHHALLWQFTRRTLHIQLRGSLLGKVWLVLNPLMMMSLYTFVFGVVFRGRYGGSTSESGIDYALGIFASLVVFQLFSESMNASATTVTGNPNLVKKVVFPLEILPASIVCANFLQFTIGLSLFMVAAVLFGNGILATWIWLPVLVLPLLGLALGIALLFSAIGVFLRDLSQITRVLSSVLLFASAVFYSLGSLPTVAQRVLALNPLAHVLEQMRAILLWGKMPAVLPTLYVYVCAGLVLALGISVFRQLSADFADAL